MSGKPNGNSEPPPAPALRTGQPGVVVPSGSLITPGGDSGPPGVAGPAGPNKVSTDAGNRAQIGSDSLIYVPPQPYADATQGGLMRQVSGRTTDFIDGTNSTQDLGVATQRAIWAVRQRSFNAVGNSNMEVDQRNAGQAVVAPAGNVFAQDRWLWGQAATVTGRVTIQQASPSSGFGIMAPVSGQNYFVTSKFLSVKLTTGQAALATGDVIYLIQFIEGPMFRELAADVHSLSLLVNCDVAMNFSAFIKDAAAGYSLVVPCSIPVAATWTIIQLPALPLWPNAGTFSVNPGAVGYQLGICLGSGATFTAPAASVWQSGNYMAAGGDNFLDFALNTTFRLAFVQHEPGANPSYLMDQNFGINLEGCQRYYQKTYNYAAKPGTVTLVGSQQWWAAANASQLVPIKWRKIMAKIPPTLTAYNPNSGAAGSVRDYTAGVDRAVNSFINPGDSGYGGYVLATTPAANASMAAHYTADTGW